MSKLKIKVSCNGGNLFQAMKEQKVSSHSIFGKKPKQIRPTLADIQKARKLASELMGAQYLPHPTQPCAFVLHGGYADSGGRQV